jgi:hypothetical protein
VTKRRAPLSVEDAIITIAAQIGWPAMEAATGKGERTIRRWGEPDRDEQLPVAAAIQLDLAFQEGGGEGAPIYEVYGLLLDAAYAERFACAHELSRHTLSALKEGGEAHAALFAASQPGATAEDRDTAAREAQEAIAALTKTLPYLIKGKGPTDCSGGDVSRGGGS